MVASVTGLWRYPIKSHGREALERVTLTEGQTMPFDRLWAVAHIESLADGSEWVPCAHFSRTAKAPGLAAISARLDEARGEITLTHPALGTLGFNPDEEPQKLIDWAGGLIPEGRLPSHRVIRAREQGFTDSDFPSVTLCNAASHRAVEARLGHEIAPERWRGNIWVEGLPAWEEFGWIGREIRLGAAVLRAEERTDRCLATHANPETGARDHDLLSVLDSFGHRDFSVRARVVRSGELALGDAVEPL
ncbi:MAG: MOSC domain-containing protein [Roseovarius sp.]